MLVDASDCIGATAVNADAAIAVAVASLIAFLIHIESVLPSNI